MEYGTPKSVNLTKFYEVYKYKGFVEMYPLRDSYNF